MSLLSWASLGILVFLVIIVGAAWVCTTMGDKGD